jgi:hypothetical protein
VTHVQNPLCFSRGELQKNKDKIDEKCNEYISGLKDGVYQSSIPRGKGSKK